MEMPIIRLEVQGMKYSIMTALTNHAAKMDADIKAAVEAYCTEENLKAVVSSVATRTLDAVIKDEVEKFFRYGDGRKAVAAAVKEKILSKRTYTNLDEV